MHVHFAGELDDGLSVSSHHAYVLAAQGVRTTFSPADSLDEPTAEQADVIHVITAHPTIRFAKAVIRQCVRGVPVVRYWTGEDGLWAEWDPLSRELAIAMADAGVLQVSRTEGLAERLGLLEIDAATGPFVSMAVSTRSQPQPLPHQFTVLCYQPPRKEAYYGSTMLDALVGEFPRTRFLVLGGTTREKEEKNVELVGRANDIGRTIQRSTVVLHARQDRTPSRLMLEALSHGRNVLANCSFPHCVLADSQAGFVKALRDLRRNADFNLAGREEVGRLYDRQLTGSALLTLLEDAIENAHSRSSVARVKAAIALPSSTPGRSPSTPDPSSLPEEAAAFKSLLEADRAVAVEGGAT